jgi:hypothetical protein
MMLKFLTSFICKENVKQMNVICNDFETGAFETGITRRAGISISTIVCRAIFIHLMQERLRFHMLKQRDTVMSFKYVWFCRLQNPLHLIRNYAQIHKKCCRHERDLERLSPNIAASPSDLGVHVGGAGSSEFVFPEDRNRYRYRLCFKLRSFPTMFLSRLQGWVDAGIRRLECRS